MSTSIACHIAAAIRTYPLQRGYRTRSLSSNVLAHLKRPECPLQWVKLKQNAAQRSRAGVPGHVQEPVCMYECSYRKSEGWSTNKLLSRQSDKRTSG